MLRVRASDAARRLGASSSSLPLLGSAKLALVGSTRSSCAAAAFGLKHVLARTFSSDHFSPPKSPIGLYDPAIEKDACGVGFVASISGESSHAIVRDSKEILERMQHRGACGEEVNTGDGAGVMVKVPHRFLEKSLQSSASRFQSAAPTSQEMSS